MIEKYLNRCVTLPSGCIIWRGPVDSRGYGLSRLKNIRKRVHIIIWELLTGRKVPIGHDLHHKCHIEPCCNFEHLELLTKKEHRRITELEKIHCPQGHEYSSANTYIYKGHRQCNICREVRNKSRYYING
jgi:hypothetical protein